MSLRARAALPWPLLLLAALMVGYLIGPLLSLLGAVPAADSSAYFGEGALPSLAVTLFAASAATLLAALFGVPLGLWLARTDSIMANLAWIRRRSFPDTAWRCRCADSRTEALPGPATCAHVRRTAARGLP